VGGCLRRRLRLRLRLRRIYDVIHGSVNGCFFMDRYMAFSTHSLAILRLWGTGRLGGGFHSDIQDGNGGVLVAYL
jgi:hypothetical protein